MYVELIRMITSNRFDLVSEEGVNMQRIGNNIEFTNLVLLIRREVGVNTCKLSTSLQHEDRVINIAFFSKIA